MVCVNTLFWANKIRWLTFGSLLLHSYARMYEAHLQTIVPRPKTLFPATDYDFIPSLNLAVLLFLYSRTHPPAPHLSPLSAEDFCCDYCINETKSDLIWYYFSFQPAAAHIFYWHWRLSRARLFVMLPFCGILFYWCSLVLWDDLYDNIMCCIFLLAGHLLTCWFSSFQTSWRITCWLVCALRTFSDLWFMKPFRCWLDNNNRKTM